MHRHHSGCMRGTAQTRIIGSDPSLNTIQHPLLQLVSVNIVFCNLQNRLVHCQVILACSYEQVDPGEKAPFPDFIVVEQGSAGSFADPNSFPPIPSGHGTNLNGDNLWIFHQLADSLDGEQNFYEAGIVVVK